MLLQAYTSFSKVNLFKTKTFELLFIIDETLTKAHNILRIK